MLKKLAEVEARYEALQLEMADPLVACNAQEVATRSRELSQLDPVVSAYKDYQGTLEEMEGARQLIEDPDPEIREMARQEIEEIELRLARIEEEIKRLLIPRDPNDDRNVFIEIRAGTGGEEAALFAADLMRMYARYAESHKLKVEVVSASPTERGGFKEVVVLVKGRGAYSRLKFEAGVHRVQRVPVTEAQGRIHTSAVTVAVLPEADEIELQIPKEDVRVDRFRSTGPGGQSVNTTDSAIRLTHIPTGLVVSCQDEKSQHKNLQRAMQVLRARLMERLRREQQEERTQARRSMVGSGDRSEKIRTYNFPQNRVTDHRLGLTLHKLQAILDGNMKEIVTALQADYQAEMLRESGL